MEVEFSDKDLSLVETDQAAETKLPIGLINALRDKLVIIRNATDERTLRNWKSLHYEKLEGRRSGQRSIRINRQWRLVFTIDTKRTPNKITVLAVEDYH